MGKNLLTYLQGAIDIDRRQREIERAHARELAAQQRARATGRTCQETTGMIGDKYLRCGQPAVVVVQHRGRNEGPYDMCYACADHNLRNRNAGVVEWLDTELEEQTKGRYRPL